MQRKKKPRIAPRLAQTVEDNVRSIFEESDNPECIRDRFLSKAEGKEGNHDLPLILRSGWQAWKTAKIDMVTNLGVIAALLLSVIMGLAMAPLTANEADDFWKEMRVTFSDVYLVLCMISAILCMLAVIFSVVYTIIVETYCVDLDDFLNFSNSKIDGLIMGLVLICVDVTCMGLSFGGVVIMGNPAATITFAIGFLGAFSGSFFAGRLLSSQRNIATQSAKESGVEYAEIVRKVYEEVCGAAEGTAQPEGAAQPAAPPVGQATTN